MGAAQAPIRGRGAPVPPGDKRAGRPSRDGEEQPETVACFALPAFFVWVVRVVRVWSYGPYDPNTWSTADFGMDPGEYPGPAGFGILRHSPGVPNPEP